MRKPLENMRIFKERRQRLAEKSMGAAVIVASPEEKIRNGSVHFPFRQDSNLYYLTGFEEPESILVFRPGMTPETVMFVRKKNQERETWDGFRFGPEAVESEFQIDKCYAIEDFSTAIVGLLKGVEKIYYRLFKNPHIDAKIEDALLSLKSSLGRTGIGILPIHDADELIGELRVKKSDLDLQNHRMACEISAEAHLEVMKYIRPGMSEREVHGYFIYQAMKRGAAREGYNGIVASGNNATTLHYVFNDEPLKLGQVLLIDCGAEYNYFTGDITRSYPVSGDFTVGQLKIYEGVLNVQKQVMNAVKPGITFQHLQDLGTQLLTELMLELGLLKGRRDDIIKANEHKKYYPHGIGHFLGMDVHDTGLYYHKASMDPRKIEPGMVFTVEPGLYIPNADTVAPEFMRGVGVRIEDNLLVTEDGFENLTALAPKEPNEMAKVIGKA
jgi:Xaa-Pro aminopeptidase